MYSVVAPKGLTTEGTERAHGNRSGTLVKKLLKRSLLVLLVLLLLAQIPFIYRRYQTCKLADKVAQLESQRTTHTDPNFKEYKGIIHAHTSLGGHSTGSFDELIAAANKNDLDFVLMTEHVTEAYDSAALTLNGVYGKTLFVGGNELDTSDGDRFLLIPGGGEAAKARAQGTAAFLEAAIRENKLALVTYPERFKSWDSAFHGIEVFSLHTSAKQMNPLAALGDLIWTYPAYPELMLAKSWSRPDANLAQFDEIAAQRPVSLFAGTDAHSNIGVHLFGDDAGNKPLGIKLDPYETIFGLARVHVLLPAGVEFNRDAVIRAIKEGSYFTGFDVLGDTTGFGFRTSAAYISGSVSAESGQPRSDAPAPVDGYGIRLIATAPVKARFVVFRNGEKFKEESDTAISEVRNAQPGVYRVEVYRDDLGPPFDKMPWIISNPIYLK